MSGQSYVNNDSNAQPLFQQMLRLKYTQVNLNFLLARCD